MELKKSKIAELFKVTVLTVDNWERKGKIKRIENIDSLKYSIPSVLKMAKENILLLEEKKKILNDAKADSIAVYKALDIASGGNLSLIKQSIAQSFHGFLEAKFNNLVLDVLSNEISEHELIEFIHSQSNSNKEFIANIILKNMHADNRITTFLLAKLWVQKTRNGSLNYYESSLFSNINSFTLEDFKIFYDAFKTIHSHYVVGVSEITTSKENEFYITSFAKFKNLGIVRSADLVDGEFIIDESALKINFYKTPFSDTFFSYLNEFFDRD